MDLVFARLMCALLAYSLNSVLALPITFYLSFPSHDENLVRPHSEKINSMARNLFQDTPI